MYVFIYIHVYIVSCLTCLAMCLVMCCCLLVVGCWLLFVVVCCLLLVVCHLLSFVVICCCCCCCCGCRCCCCCCCCCCASCCCASCCVLLVVCLLLCACCCVRVVLCLVMSLVMRRALCVVKCVGVWVVMCLDKRCCYVYAYVNLFMDQFIIQTHTNILVVARSLHISPYSIIPSLYLFFCFLAVMKKTHYKAHYTKHVFCSRFATLGCNTATLFEFTFADENLWKAHWLPPLGECATLGAKRCCDSGP